MDPTSPEKRPRRPLNLSWTRHDEQMARVVLSSDDRYMTVTGDLLEVVVNYSAVATELAVVADANIDVIRALRYIADVLEKEVGR